MVPVNMSARIVSASYGLTQLPLNSTSTSTVPAASTAPKTLGSRNRVTASATPATTSRSAISATSRVPRKPPEMACMGRRPPRATAATAKPSAYQLLRLCVPVTNSAVRSR